MNNKQTTLDELSNEYLCMTAQLNAIRSVITEVKNCCIYAKDGIKEIEKILEEKKNE